MAEGKRQLGIVRRFSAQKGFGFIAVESTGEDFFVHHTAILSKGFRLLHEGEEVEFSVDVGYDNRFRAADVFLLPKKVHSSCNMSAQKSGGDEGTLHMAPEPCHTGSKTAHIAKDCMSEGNAVELSAENGLDNRARAADVRIVSKKVSSSAGNMPTQKGWGDACDSRRHIAPEPCYTCGETGHFAAYCTHGYEAYMRSNSFYNCRKFGHFARDCSSEGNAVGFSAAKGHDNHARAANVLPVPKNVSSSAGNTLTQKSRGDDGRLRIAPEPCYTCGRMGHFAADCRSSGGNYGAYMRSESCYSCGKFGHFARDCCIVMRKKQKPVLEF